MYYSPWLFDYDLDEGYAYFGSYVGNDTYKSFRVSYSETNGVITFSDDITEVVRETVYTVVQTAEKSLTEKVIDIIKKNFSTELTKIDTFDDESMISIEPLYIAADGVDLVGDTYALEDVEFMVKSFNEVKPPMNLFHKIPAVDIDGNPLMSVDGDAWINKDAGTTFDGDIEVPVNQPLVKIKYHSKEAWEMRKAGVLGAPSVGCACRYEEIEDEA